jgi:murein DD-endopeptidase MepM/ murein hydrolase activator NlpD
MGVKQLLQTRLAALRSHAGFTPRSSAVAILALGVAAASLGMAEAAAHAEKLSGARAVPELADFISGPAPRSLTVETRLAWEGADLDGDGQPDVANPTGHAPRGEDAYGEGRFHASRDGGSRDHEGVDYVATPGQTVVAPISGYVSKIGYAYPDDQSLKFVEIENPALHLTARAFYVDPSVAVGDTVAVGRPIGQAHSLQQRYPLGITDHVHLEIAERGRKVDATTLIVARAETGPALAD